MEEEDSESILGYYAMIDAINTCFINTPVFEEFSDGVNLHGT